MRVRARVLEIAKDPRALHLETLALCSAFAFSGRQARPAEIELFALLRFDRLAFKSAGHAFIVGHDAGQQDYPTIENGSSVTRRPSMITTARPSPCGQPAVEPEEKGTNDRSTGTSR